jgi:methionyl-tRNA formyltransferase
MKPDARIAFFGSPQIAVWVLEELEKEGMFPSLIVTNPDAPKGRRMVLAPTEAARWAEAHNIPVFKPVSLKEPGTAKKLRESGCDLFIVAAYGKIIPLEILEIPAYKTLNVHPSLLPKLRGASPIRTAILENVNPTGVTIMLLTPGMDEGPILAQEKVQIADEEWPMRGTALDELLARKGGALLAKTIPTWIDGACKLQEQDHSQATFAKKITKEMGLIDLNADPQLNLRKIRAFDGWPGAYFFYSKNGKEMRVNVLDAHIEKGRLIITKVVPEGKKEMSFENLLRG